jgi:plasmid stabilization system protein ParE
VAAGEAIQTLYDGCASLSEFPDRGRISRMHGRRELVFAPLPYIAVYRVKDQTVEIIRIYHSAQDWP